MFLKIIAQVTLVYLAFYNIIGVVLIMLIDLKNKKTQTSCYENVGTTVLRKKYNISEVY